MENTNELQQRVRDLSFEYEQTLDDSLLSKLDALYVKIRHVQDRDAYVDFYRKTQSKPFLTHPVRYLDWWIRAVVGKKYKKLLATWPGQDVRYRRLEQEVRSRKAKSVLDIGCFEGQYSICLGAGNPTIDVIGMDVAESNIRAAKLVNKAPNTSFRRGMAEDVKEMFSANSFDMVVLFEVLEHVIDVDRVVDSAMHVLKPGGTLAITVPDEHNRDGTKAEYLGHAEHVRFYNTALIKHEFGKYKDFHVSILEKKDTSNRSDSVNYWYYITFGK